MNPQYAIRDTSRSLQPRPPLLQGLDPRQHCPRRRDGRQSRTASAARQDAQNARDRRHGVGNGRSQAQMRHHCRGGDGRLVQRARCPDFLSARRAELRAPGPAPPRFPDCRFSVLADHTAGIMALSRALSDEGQSVDVLLDLDIGQHRTGVAPGAEAIELYEMIHRSPGLRAGGLHVYDGHNHQESFVERQNAVRTQLQPVLKLRMNLEQKGLPTSRFVVGGTPTYPVYSRLELPGLECSPGTLVLHDHSYSSRFPDLVGFTPAALLLTHVISRPTPTRLTLDLGPDHVAPSRRRLAVSGSVAATSQPRPPGPAWQLPPSDCALAHADHAEPGAGARLGRRVHRQPDRVRVHRQPHRGGRAGRVLDRVRQRLLEDAVHGQAGGGVSPPVSPLTVRATSAPVDRTARPARAGRPRPAMNCPPSTISFWPVR